MKNTQKYLPNTKFKNLIFQEKSNAVLQYFVTQKMHPQLKLEGFMLIKFYYLFCSTHGTDEECFEFSFFKVFKFHGVAPIASFLFQSNSSLLFF